MRFLASVGLAASLAGATSVDLLLPGLSYHPDWDESGEPNPWNYGLGLSLTYTKPGDWGQVQAGAAIYNDSFSETAAVGFAGLGLRSPKPLFVEGLFGLAYWSGSGTEGLTPMGYVGAGYAFAGFDACFDVSVSSDVAVVWLKLSFPVD